MKTLLIEDKEYVRTALLNLLDLLDTEVQVVGECESVKEAVVVSKACKPDLVFLDVNLTDGTAFDFLDQIDAIDFKIIFITAHEEYALQALKIGAVDYLLKPVDLEDLEKAIKKIAQLSINEQQTKIQTAQQAWKGESKNIILSLQDSFQVVNLNELMYCESDKGYTTFYCSNNKKYIASKTLKEFEERLNSNDFARPHQSYIVNLNFIDKLDKSGTIYLKNGKKIPISTRKKEVFVTKFLNR